MCTPRAEVTFVRVVIVTGRVKIHNTEYEIHVHNMEYILSIDDLDFIDIDRRTCKDYQFDSLCKYTPFYVVKVHTFIQHI